MAHKHQISSSNPKTKRKATRKWRREYKQWAHVKPIPYQRKRKAKTISAVG